MYFKTLYNDHHRNLNNYFLKHSGFRLYKMANLSLSRTRYPKTLGLLDKAHQTINKFRTMLQNRRVLRRRQNALARRNNFLSSLLTTP